MNDIITLVAQKMTIDTEGDQVVEESTRNIFCDVASIGMKEFYEAQAVGLKPEIKFKIADNLDYSNEQIVIFNSVRYRVLRTYRTGIALEIICYTEVNAPVYVAPTPEPEPEGGTPTPEPEPEGGTE